MFFFPSHATPNLYHVPFEKVRFVEFRERFMTMHLTEFEPSTAHTTLKCMCIIIIILIRRGICGGWCIIITTSLFWNLSRRGSASWEFRPIEEWAVPLDLVVIGCEEWMDGMDVWSGCVTALLRFNALSLFLENIIISRY